ncbi:guanylate kinase [Gordoniibacillus kamchatkensis]|uniref:Guanylate kinase n=1 Tax=Gordoniibacillus kamchatkensis TaxID=1590651 RepID=A0ABR5AAT3_9BACL|nr:guanylate kinase [Paenibacillus sp. VKM B-2647]KIL38075.1 guanylate kinase [Paenibacillus sp. VKM B-2647]
MYELKEKEMIFVFTGPNGAGRRTVADMSGSTLGVKQVISYTTRPPRANEVDGQDYHFLKPAQFFQAQQNGEFLEISEIDGNLYGVKSRDIEERFRSKGSIYLILNRYGAQKLKELYGDHVVRIFIYADRRLVEQRFREKGYNEEQIAGFMSHFDEEMAYKDECEHAFENIDLAHTVFDLTKTLDKYLERNLLDLD